jgi:transposase InsO family protein
MIIAFIDTMRLKAAAVESICRILFEQGGQIAAHTYQVWRIRRPIGRTIADAQTVDVVETSPVVSITTPEGLYGQEKDGGPRAGWVYVVFIIDVFSRKVVAWHASTSKGVTLVGTPLRMAMWHVTTTATQ